MKKNLLWGNFLNDYIAKTKVERRKARKEISWWENVYIVSAVNGPWCRRRGWEGRGGVRRVWSVGVHRREDTHLYSTPHTLHQGEELHPLNTSPPHPLTPATPSSSPSPLATTRLGSRCKNCSTWVQFSHKRAATNEATPPQPHEAEGSAALNDFFSFFSGCKLRPDAGEGGHTSSQLTLTLY